MQAGGSRLSTPAVPHPAAALQDVGGESVSGHVPLFLRGLGRRSRLVGVDMPETRYARSGDVMIAYQVLGEGSFDVVVAPGFVSHVELQWEAAGWAAFLRGVAEHARVLVFDKRGTGMSDRVAVRPRWKSAVMTSGR
jgi:hypothetical protein